MYSSFLAFLDPLTHRYYTLLTKAMTSAECLVTKPEDIVRNVRGSVNKW